MPDPDGMTPLDAAEAAMPPCLACIGHPQVPSCTCRAAARQVLLEAVARVSPEGGARDLVWRALGLDHA